MYYHNHQVIILPPFTHCEIPTSESERSDAHKLSRAGWAHACPQDSDDVALSDGRFESSKEHMQEITKVDSLDRDLQVCACNDRNISLL